MAGGAPGRDAQSLRPLKMAELVATRIRRMIAREELRDGDWLPTEVELIERFGVARPTLREAFRLLEADSLVKIRRGPPGGARVRVPGPEAAAAQFGLLLTLAGTTLTDVHEARMVIEPPAVRKLAEEGSPSDHQLLAEELDTITRVGPNGESFALATVRFHQRLVELSGNHTLATVIGTLGEIVWRQTARAYIEASADEIAADNRKAIRAYERVVHLIRERKGADAERFWLRHMHVAGDRLLAGRADQQVVDILD